MSDIAGGILKPTLAGSSQLPGQQPEKLVSDDLDSSLANLVGSECVALLFSCTNLKHKFIKMIRDNIRRWISNTSPPINFLF